jgi:hypothetical protein
MKNVMRTALRALCNALPAKQSLQIQCLKALHQWPNLAQPKTFNEHINALKLAPRNPLFPLLADKVKVKDWVAERVGRGVIIPTTWTGTELPEHAPCAAPFVIKANHSSGWNHFVRTEDPAEWSSLRESTKNWLNEDWHPHLHEWWYNDIDRLLLIEPIIGENLNDYKFFCFNGKVKIIQVDGERFTDHRRSFFNTKWEVQPFELIYPRIAGDVPAPRHMAKMVELAEELSRGFPFARVDFYDLECGPFFGEITFAPEAGFGRFNPRSADLALGQLWSGTAGADPDKSFFTSLAKIDSYFDAHIAA